MVMGYAVSDGGVGLDELPRANDEINAPEATPLAWPETMTRLPGERIPEAENEEILMAEADGDGCAAAAAGATTPTSDTPRQSVAIPSTRRCSRFAMSPPPSSAF
jgi:hypothetical protein